MRITPFMIFNQLTQSLDRSLQDYATLNEQLASGKKILAPSDDPNGLKRSLDYKVRISNNGQYQQNIGFAQNNLNAVNTVMTSYDKFLTIATTLTSRSLNSDPSARATNAQQAAAMRDIFLDLGNTKISDQYLFAGFNSGTQPYAAGTFGYQGDSGVVNVPIDNGAVLAANVTGDNVFSYTLPAATSKKLPSGNVVHYTPGAGTTVGVEIRDATDTTVLDTFSFSNVIQMTDTLSTAISNNDTTRLEVLADTFRQAQLQLRSSQTDVGSRLQWLNTQSTGLTQSTDSLQAALSSVEDADMTAVTAQLKTTEVTLQAVRESASRVLSMSLFDFLK
jgi:flagellar hook-associated protein 3 FlgL